MEPSTPNADLLKNNQRKSKGTVGGRREGAGRPKGSVSPVKRLEQVTKAAIKELALQHAEKAINALVEVINDKEHSQRVSAANALLDRGLGKPTQEIVGDPENPLNVVAQISFKVVDPRH